MMKSLQWIAPAMLAIASSSAVSAADVPAATGKDLAAAKHCDVCHSATTPKVGPAFREVARRYAGLDNGKALIVRIIRTGSAGPAAVYHWNSSPMPPDAVRIPVSDAEANVLADYVLSFK